MSAKYSQVKYVFEVWIICETLWKPWPEGRPPWSMLLLLSTGKYWKSYKSLYLLHCTMPSNCPKAEINLITPASFTAVQATTEVGGLEIFFFLQVQIVTYFQSPCIYHVLSNVRFLFSKHKLHIFQFRMEYFYIIPSLVFYIYVSSWMHLRLQAVYSPLFYELFRSHLKNVSQRNKTFAIL